MESRIAAIVAIAILLVIPTAYAFPPQPHDVYGEVTINEDLAPVGTVIFAKDPDNVTCGTFTVKEEGTYGFLHIKGDDTSTMDDEGAVLGDTITFHTGSLQAEQTIVWQEMGKSSLDLSFLPEAPADIEPPKMPHDIYGTVTINGSAAEVGTIITTKDHENNSCGTFALVTEGYYGYLHIYCLEVSNGYEISFHADGLVAKETILWQEGALTVLNLTFGELAESPEQEEEETEIKTTSSSGSSGSSSEIYYFCGDGICRTDEGCSVCPEDCGVCKEELCSELWQCGNWSECINGVQERICEDVNLCGTENLMPEISRNCSICVEEWLCGEWSECLGGLQMRTCTDVNSCGTYDLMPPQVQDCEITLSSPTGLFTAINSASSAIIAIILIAGISLAYWKSKA